MKTHTTAPHRSTPPRYGKREHAPERRRVSHADGADGIVPQATVAPGPVWTPLNPSAKSAEEVSQFGGDTPMRRPAQPEELAPAYVFFASDVDSSFISGEVLAVLGGETTAG